MAKMRAAMAAVLVLEKENVTQAFGVPGAAINPFYAALRERQSIAHVLARHVEGASHMAEGYTRAQAGNIGVCIGTSGPAGTDMITGLYSASADSIPILCITGQAPRARLYKEDFQAVDIESIAKPVTKWAVTVREPALVPRVLQQAFHLMRSGRPGPVLVDLPFDVQMAEIDFDIDTYEPLPVYQPRATRKQVEKALDMLAASDRPLIVAGGGLSQIAGAQFLHVYGPRRWINCGQAGPLGWTVPAALGVVAADPSRMVVGLSGDYDFQFMIEELAVGAQFNLPYVQVLVNNSYLGLIRQAQRGFDMDYCVQLAFENQNVSDPALQGYGVDHVQVIQGLGCKAIRVTDPGKLRASLLEAQALARKHRVPVVVEVILERVTNIAMGTEIDNIVEFEDIDCRHPEGAKGLAEAGLLA